MPDSTNPSGPSAIKSDEDWKERMRNESRQLDAQAAPADPPKSTAAPATQADPTDDDLAHLPPADFLMLVQMFSTQAIVTLGLLPDPQTGETAPQLNLARHFIDLLSVLETKTKGNLTPDEERVLTTNLHELRMAFVEQSRSTGA